MGETQGITLNKKNAQKMGLRTYARGAKKTRADYIFISYVRKEVQKRMTKWLLRRSPVGAGKRNDTA